MDALDLTSVATQVVQLCWSWKYMYNKNNISVGLGWQRIRVLQNI